LQERTNLVLGLTYFELGDFENAIAFLKKVSSGDENYPHALLGLGWCYLKQQQYQFMIKPLEEYVKTFPESEFLPEVYLLLGQAHLKIRLYDKSIYYFSRLLTMFPVKSENGNLLSSIENKVNVFESQVEKQRLDLILLESNLSETIRLPSKKWIPGYMLDEIRKLEKRRMLLLEQIQNEKTSLKVMTQTMSELKLMIQIRTRDWRSVAEYGISRALFLKEQEG